MDLESVMLSEKSPTRVVDEMARTSRSPKTEREPSAGGEHTPRLSLATWGHLGPSPLLAPLPGDPRTSLSSLPICLDFALPVLAHPEFHLLHLCANAGSRPGSRT